MGFLKAMVSKMAGKINPRYAECVLDFSKLLRKRADHVVSTAQEKPGREVSLYVSTANQEPVVSKGTGTIQIGHLKLANIVHVPSFSKNLLSGIQIMK
jgi:hypothetical protein